MGRKRKNDPIPIHVQWVLDNTDVDTYDKSPEGEGYLFDMLFFARMFFIIKRRLPISVEEFLAWLYTTNHASLN